MTRRSAFTCLLLLMIGVQAGAQDSQSNFEISLKRTACFGSCPVYTVTIKGDGSVTYFGDGNVRVQGKQEYRVEKADVKKLLDEIVMSGYFKLEDSYTSVKNPDGTKTTVTDRPTKYLSVRIGEKTKSVEDYFGAPEFLTDIEARIDKLAGTRKWIFIDPETAREMALHGWNAKNKREQELISERYLMEAAGYGYADVVQALLEAGVDPETPLLPGTPLQMARNVETVQALLRAGANPNALGRGDYGETPLQNAARYGSSAALQALIDAGADINYSGKYGETVLMYAVYGGNAENVELLIKAGAKVNARTKEGKTALRIALENLKIAEGHRYLSSFVKNDYPAIVEFLKKAGAN